MDSMDKKFHFDRDGLYFLPLGGSGEIGMNLNVYVCQGQALIVDVGVSFEQTLGVEVIMPDIRALRSLRKKICGIVMTHAHEDHIGAIAYLLDALGNHPIYATPFTAGMIRHKLKEWHVRGVIHEVPLGGTVDLDPFKVTFVRLTHSIPEPNALAIETPHGVIMHTGDWKIDPHPVLGEATDEKALKAFGDKGVLAVVCDSTSVFEKGWSGSEQQVQNSLVELVKTFPDRRVVIGCFASNVARLLSCYEAAKASGRHLGLVGRSLERIDQVARSCGYFEDIEPFLKERDIGKVERKRSLIVSTGSQGEARAALMRMAFNQHPRVHLDEGDVVIFSSRIIPGNEKAIHALQNQLARRGIEVVTHRDAEDIHVSGHPSEDELIQMYRWLRPKMAIPVHGEERHLQAHAALAKRLGIEQSLSPRNGQVIRLAPQSLSVVGEVFSGRLALDGERLVPWGGAVLTERSQMMSLGFAQIALALSSANGKTRDVQVNLWGLAEPEERDEMATSVAIAVRESVEELVAGERGQDTVVRQVASQAARRVLSEFIGKKPLVNVQVIRV